MGDEIGAGRANQKERTRRALIEAARGLIATGEVPTVARTAERALVSLATAYRYFPDQRSLSRETLVLKWPELDAIAAEIVAIPNLGERARHAAQAMALHVLANEREMRMLIAATYQDGSDGPARPAFRERLIAAVLDGAVGSGGRADRARPALELSVIVAAEAVLGLKDQGISDRDTASTLASMAADVVLRSGLLSSPSTVTSSGRRTEA